MVVCVYCLTAFSNPIPEEEWELAWCDDFNGNRLDTAVWGYMKRGKDPSRKYHSSNPLCYDFRDGKIVIKGIRNPERDTDTASYLTGAITTEGKLSFKPGRIEIRAKLGSAKGAWPAFWMLPYPPDRNWPGGGELDIMEHLNYDEFAYQTVHSKYTKSDRDAKPQRFVKSRIDKDDFNVYRIDFLPDRIDFYTNGIRTLSYPKVDSLLSKGQFPFDHDWFLMLDMQLGGRWVGRLDPNDLPVEMEIDWVKYYRQKHP